MESANKIAELMKMIECPCCKHNNFQLSSDKQLLTCGNCEISFPATDGIPVMLPGKQSMRSEQPEIHRLHDTTFDYGDHYEKDAHEFDYFQTRSGATKHYEKRVREYAASKIPGIKGKILDVGSGCAWVAEKFCPRGYVVVSLDIAHRNVKKALNKFQYENHMGIVADAFKLPFRECAFDHVIASEVIEHVADPMQFIHSLLRVVKPGGSLIITTPYKEKIIYSLCVHCNRMTPMNAHLHSFDEKKLSDLYSGRNLDSLKISLFGNKVLIHLRTYIFLRFMPFRIWKLTDKISNLIYKAPSSALAVFLKE